MSEAAGRVQANEVPDPLDDRRAGAQAPPAAPYNPRYPQCPPWMFALFLAFVVARYIQATARMDLLSAIRLEFLLGGVSVICALTYLPNRTLDIRPAKPLMIAIALLFFAMIVQLPMAADPGLARVIFNDRVFKFAMLTFLMAVLIESRRYLWLFQLAFLFSIFYITFESTRGLITGGLYWQNQGVMRLHGAVPIYQHPNNLGGVALGSLPFLWFYWNEIKPFYQRLCVLVFATTSLICVIYSGSRTAYLGLLGLGVWIWLQSGRKAVLVLRLLIVGAVVVMMLPQQYIERFQSIGGKEKEGHSSEARIEILRDAWTVFLENPLGVGVASFPAKRFERFGRSQDTHNLYLEVATNLGIQGLFVFGFLVYALMASFQRSVRDFTAMRRRLRDLVRAQALRGAPMRGAARIDRDLRFFIATAKAGGGFIFVRLVLGMFGMDLYEVYWWYGAGLAIVLAGLDVHMQKHLRAVERALRPAAA